MKSVNSTFAASPFALEAFAWSTRTGGIFTRVELDLSLDDRQRARIVAVRGAVRELKRHG
jgi:hypothetical protein